MRPTQDEIVSLSSRLSTEGHNTESLERPVEDVQYERDKINVKLDEIRPRKVRRQKNAEQILSRMGRLRAAAQRPCGQLIEHIKLEFIGYINA